ncbi:hypothetical protein [Xanthomarina sp.]|uniref:hypothetical protein n=1 Tax=Xanthomarina sp. TaxID=1931211 RepID=UPI002CF17594|nr:hypothetical protein [Xanthomarina sp.]HLV38225.1 hypothetical protein [Xanthomarina sp.]
MNSFSCEMIKRIEDTEFKEVSIIEIYEIDTLKNLYDFELHKKDFSKSFWLFSHSEIAEAI